ISATEPLMSAKSAVIVFRSPSGDAAASRAACAARMRSARCAGSRRQAGGPDVAVAPSGCPHASQKRWPLGLELPHAEQVTAAASGAAHPPQNFAPARLGWPHAAHPVALRGGRVGSLAALCVDPCMV